MKTNFKDIAPHYSNAMLAAAASMQQKTFCPSERRTENKIALTLNGKLSNNFCLKKKDSQLPVKATSYCPNISLPTSFLRAGTFLVKNANCFSDSVNSWIFKSSGEPLNACRRLATWLLSPTIAELSPDRIAYRCLHGAPWSPAGQVQKARMLLPSISKVV